MILGLLKPYTGSIILFGKPQEKFNSWNKIGYMPQNISLLNPVFPATVEEVISLGLLSAKNSQKLYQMKINKLSMKLWII